MHNNQEISEQFLNSIKTIENVPCYVRMNESRFLVIALHEHLGLVEGFSEIVCNLVSNSASIIIPDLFCNIQGDKIDEDDQFSCFKQMSFDDVGLILRKCVNFAVKKDKVIIILGFSTGAALGLKLIEQFSQVSLGMFFYGYPIAKSLIPDKIKSRVIIFHANKDNIKYLSDQDQLKPVNLLYTNRPHIRIQRLNSSHGFMNHQHQNYDQKSFRYCQNIFYSSLSDIQKGQNPVQKSQIPTQNKKEQESGICSIF